MGQNEDLLATGFGHQFEIIRVWTCDTFFWSFVQQCWTISILIQCLTSRKHLPNSKVIHPPKKWQWFWLDLYVSTVPNIGYTDLAKRLRPCALALNLCKSSSFCFATESSQMPPVKERMVGHSLFERSKKCIAYLKNVYLCLLYQCDFQVGGNSFPLPEVREAVFNGLEQLDS